MAYVMSTDTGNSEKSSIEISNTELLAGGTLLTVAMIASGAGNYLANLILGKFLTAAEFGDAALMVTFLLASTVLTGGTQLLTAKVTASSAVRGSGSVSVAVGDIRAQATFIAATLAILAVVSSPVLTDVFDLQSSWLIPLMALGLPVHMLLSVDRGQLQGQLELKSLAATFVAEVAVRLVATVGLVAFGMGAVGATAAINLAFLGGLVVSRRALGSGSSCKATEIADPIAATSSGLSSSSPTNSNFKTAAHVALLSLGTVLITNGDLVVAKIVLTPENAGRYALVGLVGRVVYMLAVALHGTMIPLVIRASVQDRPKVKQSCLRLVAAASLAATVGIWALDEFIISIVGGSDYESVAGLLGPYAFAAGLFTIASTSATLGLAVDEHQGSWLLLAGAALQTSLFVFGGPTSGQQIVTMQVIAMAVLLSAILLGNKVEQSVRNAAWRTTVQETKSAQAAGAIIG